MAVNCHNTPGLPVEPQSEVPSLDLWLLDAMLSDLVEAGRVINVASKILCEVPHVGADGARPEELEEVAAILTAAHAHLEKMTARLDGQYSAWWNAAMAVSA